MEHNTRKNTAFTLLIIAFFLTFKSYAQETVALNTSSFETQRKYINNLLEERNQKFGTFNTSLEQKTGIFGLFKSKNDMQKSMDILKAIVLNDNHILHETKKLLSLKDGERDRFERLAIKYDAQVTDYMRTISKLQLENERLREQIKSDTSDANSADVYLFIAIILILSLAGICIKLYITLKRQKVTKV